MRDRGGRAKCIFAGAQRSPSINKDGWPSKILLSQRGCINDPSEEVGAGSLSPVIA